jgi:acetyl-CoA synthetase
VIISSGFTIGAEEIEECLRTHPAVDQAAVIAIPDPDRGHVPKAFVQLAEQAGPATSERQSILVAALQDHVREKLGRYAYPKEIAFVQEFDLNEAGKIRKATLRDR